MNLFRGRLDPRWTRHSPPAWPSLALAPAGSADRGRFFWTCVFPGNFAGLVECVARFAALVDGRGHEQRRRLERHVTRPAVGSGCAGCSAPPAARSTASPEPRGATPPPNPRSQGYQPPRPGAPRLVDAPAGDATAAPQDPSRAAPADPAAKIRFAENLELSREE